MKLIVNGGLAASCSLSAADPRIENGAGKARTRRAIRFRTTIGLLTNEYRV